MMSIRASIREDKPEETIFKQIWRRPWRFPGRSVFGISGIIIVDLIDMSSPSHRQKVLTVSGGDEPQIAQRARF